MFQCLSSQFITEKERMSEGNYVEENQKKGLGELATFVIHNCLCLCNGNDGNGKSKKILHFVAPIDLQKVLLQEALQKDE